MEGFLNRVKSWLRRVREMPLLGSMAEDLMTLLDLLGDYVRGIYRELPRGTLVGIVLALGYALSPVDLILDIIPFAGLLDDAAILGLLLEFGVARDLLHYRHWRGTLRGSGLKALRENLTAQLLTRIGDNRLAAAYLTEEKKIRLLLCRKDDRRSPLPCNALLTDLPEQQLAALGVERWEDIGEFCTQVFQDPRLPWSHLGPRPFMPEYDPKAKSDEFIVE